MYIHKKHQQANLDINFDINFFKSLSTFLFVNDSSSKMPGLSYQGWRFFFNVRTRNSNITLNPLDYGRAEEARLDPCENVLAGAFIAVLDVLILNSDIDKIAKA